MHWLVREIKDTENHFTCWTFLTDDIYFLDETFQTKESSWGGKVDMLYGTKTIFKKKKSHLNIFIGNALQKKFSYRFSDGNCLRVSNEQ